LTEALEQPMRHLIIEADSGVAYFQGQDWGIRKWPVVNINRDPDLALSGELDGVGDEVPQHLFDPDDIAAEPALHGRPARDGECQPLLLGARPEQVCQTFKLRPEIEGLNIQLEPSRLDLGEIQ